MTATASIGYGTNATHTITLASLAASSTAGRAGTAIDNSSNLFVDYLVQGKITTGTTPSGAQIEVYVYGSADGTNYTGGATGTDAALTPANKSVMKLLEVIPVSSTSNVTHTWGPWSVNQVFGGTVPAKWGVFIVNNTGVALNATPGNHTVFSRPVNFTSA